MDPALSPPESQPQSSAPANIFSTCRALQSLITTNLTSPHTMTKASCTPPSLASPIKLVPASHLHRKILPSPASQVPPAPDTPHPQTPPPTSRKRRRSDSDSAPTTTPNGTLEPTLPSTPKRQRLCPPTLPLGLSPSDFSALQDEAATIPIPCTPGAPLRRRRNQPSNTHTNANTFSPHSSSTSTQIPNQDTTANPTSPDSSALISLILHKLRLRQIDWDDCGRLLGTGHDSIGERFKMLLGDEAGALRRGKGGKSRRSVTQMEFGPPLPGLGKE